MTQALRHYKRGRISVARRYMNDYNELAEQSDPVALAFDATLSVLEKDSASADRKFQEARSNLELVSSRDDRQYIEFYCLMYEDMIHHKQGTEEYRTMASNLEVSSKVRDWLNFPPENFYLD